MESTLKRSGDNETLRRPAPKKSLADAAKRTTSRHVNLCDTLQSTTMHNLELVKIRILSAILERLQFRTNTDWINIKLAAVAGLEHDPEKWEPVFGEDHAPTIR
jgi:hypothetical protein